MVICTMSKLLILFRRNLVTWYILLFIIVYIVRNLIVGLLLSKNCYFHFLQTFPRISTSISSNTNEFKYHPVNRNEHKSRVSRVWRIKGPKHVCVSKIIRSSSSSLLPVVRIFGIRCHASKISRLAGLAAFVSVPRFAIKRLSRLRFHDVSARQICYTRYPIISSDNID